MQIVNYHGHLTSALWPSSVSGNCNKFQEILEFIPGNVFLSCGNSALDTIAFNELFPFCLGFSPPAFMISNVNYLSFLAQWRDVLLGAQIHRNATDICNACWYGILI